MRAAALLWEATSRRRSPSTWREVVGIEVVEVVKIV